MKAPQTIKILREAKAGLDERGDVRVFLALGEENSGIQIEIESTLMSLFGDQIRASAMDVIAGYGLKDLKLTIRDQGALDYAIRARIQTAVERAIKEGE